MSTSFGHCPPVNVEGTSGTRLRRCADSRYTKEGSFAGRIARRLQQEPCRHAYPLTVREMHRLLPAFQVQPAGGSDRVGEPVERDRGEEVRRGDRRFGVATAVGPG